MCARQSSQPNRKMVIVKCRKNVVPTRARKRLANSINRDSIKYFNSFGTRPQLANSRNSYNLNLASPTLVKFGGWCVFIVFRLVFQMHVVVDCVYNLEHTPTRHRFRTDFVRWPRNKSRGGSSGGGSADSVAFAAVLIYRSKNRFGVIKTAIIFLCY